MNFVRSDWPASGHSHNDPLNCSLPGYPDCCMMTGSVRLALLLAGWIFFTSTLHNCYLKIWKCFVFKRQNRPLGTFYGPPRRIQDFVRGRACPLPTPDKVHGFCLFLLSSEQPTGVGGLDPPVGRHGRLETLSKTCLSFGSF